MRSRCIVLAVSFIVLLAPCAISAGDSPFDKSEWEEVNIKLGVGYRYFTDEGMSEAYTGCGELTFRFSARGMKILSLEQEEVAKPFKSGLRGELGVLLTAGEPIQKDNDWEIMKSDLAMIAMPLAISYFYRLTDDPLDSFAPYCGIGLGGIFGFERISVHAYRPYMLDEVHYEWHDTCYRHSFAAHACFGIYKKLDEHFGLLLELRWTQAGKGKLKRGELGAEELEQGWGEVFDDFQHSDFNFTGPSVNVSLRW